MTDEKEHNAAHESHKESKHEHSSHEKHHEHHESKKASDAEKSAVKSTGVSDNLIWQILTGVLAIALIVSIFTGGFWIQKSADAAKISADDAGQKAIYYINNNLLPDGMSATFKSIEESGSFYKMKMNIGGKEYESLITKDGGLLIPDGRAALDMSKPIPKPETPEEQAEAPIPKTDKPTVDLYVMSFCPFGNKAEDTMYPVYKLLKDKVNWNIRYIVSADGDTIRSLHGQPETDQNIRELCVQKNYGLDKMWQFMTYVNTNCGSSGSCWETAAKDAGLDAAKIKSCYDKEGIELMKKEAQASNTAGASGSPTMFINGQTTRTVYQYGQSDAYKEAICSAFNVSPEECKQVLGTSASGTASGGSC